MRRKKKILQIARNIGDIFFYLTKATALFVDEVLFKRVLKVV